MNAHSRFVYAHRNIGGAVQIGGTSMRCRASGAVLVIGLALILAGSDENQ